jgi:hypothetical protein
LSKRSLTSDDFRICNYEIHSERSSTSVQTVQRFLLARLFNSGKVTNLGRCSIFMKEVQPFRDKHDKLKI